MGYKTATTKLPEEKLVELKKKTEENTNKEALNKAIYHYLSCPYVEEGEWKGWDDEAEAGEKTKRGRRPFYIEKYFKDRRKE